MIHLAFYGLLLLSVLSTVLLGRKTLLYTAALLMPLVQVMPEPVGTISTPVNLIVLGLAGGILLHQQKDGLASARLPIRRSVIFLVLMLLLGLALRAVAELRGESYLPPFTIAAKNTWRLMTAFVFYWVAFRNAGGGLDARRVVALFQLSLLMQAAIAVFERMSGTGRGSASFGEANMAGAYFAGGSAFFLAWFLMDSTVKKWLFFGSWLLCIFSLFVTLSRGGMLAAAVAGSVVIILFYFLAGRKTGTKFVFLLILVLMIVNFSLLVPQWVTDRILFTFTQHSETAGEEKLDDSSEERLLFWRISGELYQKRPFGWGAFTFPQLMSQYFSKTKQTHNIYLEILVEFGIQGMLALVIMVLSTLGNLFRNFRKHESEWSRTLALSLLGWWTAHVVSHFFINSFFLMEICGQFWLMFAVLNASEVARSAPTPHPRPSVASAKESGTPSSVSVRRPKVGPIGNLELNQSPISASRPTTCEDEKMT